MPPCVGTQVVNWQNYVFSVSIIYMARKWTKEEESYYHRKLNKLYIRENKTINEISEIIGISPQSVYIRLKRLGIKTCPKKKTRYSNKRIDVKIPIVYTKNLAEFFGIMLGDGHLSHFQVVITLGTKELKYAEYVSSLIEENFNVKPRIAVRGERYRDVYVGSVEITSWLFNEGLVHNKVKSQVDIPNWIFSDKEFMKRFLRGFFDTDGSVYKLRYGIQISLKNHSRPLLVSLQRMLKGLGYRPSRVSNDSVYVTNIYDIMRFFEEIQPANIKHKKRFDKFIKQYLRR